MLICSAGVVLLKYENLPIITAKIKASFIFLSGFDQLQI